ncbi:MAG: hypothetical protein II764_07740 [Bacteroidales bacterium]|nr:hypothetical protein [Bacteroidales bacterium]
MRIKLIILLALALLFQAVPTRGQEPDSTVTVSADYEECFNSVVALMEEYDGRGNVSLMKLGKLAMTMGKTVGRAGSEWTRKVAKAFKRVNTVYMLEYGESSPRLREEIESRVSSCLPTEHMILRNGSGELVFDETYGQVSEDGKHVSDLIIIMYDQSVVCIKGTVLRTDVERIVRRLNKQL